MKTLGIVLLIMSISGFVLLFRRLTKMINDGPIIIRDHSDLQRAIEKDNKEFPIYMALIIGSTLLLIPGLLLTLKT